MGHHLTFLTLLFSILIFGSPVFAAEPKCLACHTAHYGERGDCVDCHRGNPRTQREDIAHHKLIEGRFAHFTIEKSPVAEGGVKSLERYACRRCHIWGGGGNKLAANLDRSLPHRGPGELFKAIGEPASFMPMFNFTDEQSVELVNAILAAGLSQPPAAEEAPEVVHFIDLAPAALDPFTRKCGACHRLLSMKLGGLGKGDMGPNLSGLFSPHYPNNFDEGQRWSDENLRKWLENPRKVRDFARMAPLRLTTDELGRLLEIFRDR